jgi:hypothetical protein
MISFTLRACNINLVLLTLPAPEAGDFLEWIMLYTNKLLKFQGTLKSFVPYRFLCKFIHVIILTPLHSNWCGVKLKTPCIINMCQNEKEGSVSFFGWSTHTVKSPDKIWTWRWPRSGRQNSPPGIDHVKNMCLHAEVINSTEKIYVLQYCLFLYPVLRSRQFPFSFLKQRGKAKLTFFYIHRVGLKNSPNHF